MQLQWVDWAVIAAYGALALAVGVFFARRAGQGTEDFFLAGRKLPWWLLGTSMVATTFSTDTPNLVTDLVRNGGVAGNWAWWAFLLTGMLTVFVTLVIQGLDMVQFAAGQRSEGLRIPLSWPYAALPVAFGFATLFALGRLLTREDRA